MATKEELSEQLAVTQKLAAAVDAMARSMSRVESSYEAQINAVEKLTRAVEALKGQDLSGLNNTKLDGLRKEVKESEETVTSLSGRIKDLGESLSDRFPKASLIGAAALSGLVQGFRSTIALSKGVLGFFSSLIDSIFNVAAAIVAIPFKLFSRLIDMAAGAGGGMNELALAIENVRKQFGALAGPGASAVLTTASTLKGFSDTGLSAWRVFGMLHDRIEAVLKVATAMGATFSRLTEEFRENGIALLAFQKGLGVSDEQMKAVGDRAITMGKPMSKVFLDMTKQTLALGKAFNIDQKLIGRDMAKALQDVKHFGALATKEIAQAAVYSRKLGVELEKIVGILDAFETFDQAAENAAKLSQTFGVQIDAFQMMEAQNPAEQIDMLRKQFKAAGIDASQFTRQQAKLLATTTGLDEATARQVFSLQNQGMSLDEIKKKSEAAEKKQMTQAEAMSKLADSIERLVKPGIAQKGGFWDMFVEGISRGIQSSKEFRSIVWNIKVGLYTVMAQGVRLGRELVNVFPGVKEFLGGIADFFQPAKFKQLTGSVVVIIVDFFRKLRSGQWSFEQLMKDLKEKFFNFFDRQMPAGKKMLEGFKETFKTISKVVAEGIKWAVDRVGEGIRFITDAIRDPSKLVGQAKGAAGQLGFLGEILMPLVDALKHAWKVIAPALWELVMTLGKKLWEYLKSDEFISLIKPALPYVAGVLFGPMFARAILGALTASLAQASVALFTQGATKKMIQDTVSKAMSQLSAATQQIAAAPPDPKAMKAVTATQIEAAKAQAAGRAGGGWRQLGMQLAKLAGAIFVGGVALAAALITMKGILWLGHIREPDDAKLAIGILAGAAVAALPLALAMKMVDRTSDARRLGLSMLKLAGAILVGGGAMALALLGFYAIVKNFDPLTVIASLGTMTLAALAAVPLAFAMQLASRVPLGKVVMGGIVVGATIGVITGIGALINYLMKKVGSLSELKQAADIMLSMSLVFLATVPVIGAAMLLGALVTGPQAILLGLAAAGMGVIGAAVAEMAGISLMILKSLEGIPATEEMKTKVDLFLGVMKAIQSFVDSMVKIIGMMEPSFIEILIRSDKFEQRVNASIELITTLIGAKGSGAGIIGLVETALDLVKGLPTGEEIAQKASIFGSVVQAMTGLLEALKPPDEFLKATTDIFGLPTGALDGSMISQVQEYVFQMGSAMVRMADKAVGIVKQLVGIPIPNVADVEALTKLMGSLASIMKELTPSPQLAQSFMDTTDTKWYHFTGKVQKFDAAGAAKFFETSRDQMEKLLPVIKDTLSSLADKLAGYNTKQIESLKIVGPIMASISEVISSIVKSAKGKEVSPVEIDEMVHWAVKEAPNYEKVFESLGKVIPDLLGSVIKAVEGIKVGSNFEAMAKTAEQLFGFLKTITDVVGTLAGAGTGQMIDPTAMVHALQKLAYFMWAIMEGGGGFGRGAHGAPGASPLRLIVSDLKKMSELGLSDAKSSAVQSAAALAGLFESLKKIVDAVDGMPATSEATGEKAIESLQGLVTLIDQLTGEGIVGPGAGGVLSQINKKLGGAASQELAQSAKVIKQFSENFKGISDAIRAGAIIPALQSVEEMIEQTKLLDDALAKLGDGKLNVVANLEKVAKAAGLGGKAVYQVKSKEVVINLNVQVNMNVDEVEKVMIMRKSSIIRDRLNFATGDGAGEKGTPPIPETYASSLQNIIKGGD